MTTKEIEITIRYIKCNKLTANWVVNEQLYLYVEKLNGKKHGPCVLHYKNNHLERFYKNGRRILNTNEL